MKKAYIIDDDKNIVESLSIVLKQAGYEVGSQYDDLNVVENLAKFGADILILDVMFPENDSSGFELARSIKNDEKTKDIPILMLSAINAQQIYPGSFSKSDKDDTWLPVDDFVEKPISPKVLLEKVNALVSA